MAEETEYDVIQRMLPELEAEGYEVLLHPDKLATPTFLGSYRPDILARRPDRNLVIDIKRRKAGATAPMDAIAGLVREHKDWDYRIVWIEPTSVHASLRLQSRAMIERRLEEAKKVASSGHREFAMLLAWGIFEAVARVLMPVEFETAQTPARIVQMLAKDGYLTPSEADHLRALANKRNRLVHGELQETVAAEELNDLIAAIQELVDQLSDQKVRQA